MNLVNRLSILAVILFSINVLADPPSPPAGKVWIAVESMSDEFNDSFDATKWAKNYSGWAGRKPGLFVTSAVTMGDGNMRITADLLDNPYDGWTHEGGLVRSLNKAYDTWSPYFECRMKANKTFMSSTFWLINQSQDEAGCDKRVTELDIDETVGYNSGGASWIDNMMRRMNSNTHSRNIPSGCDFSTGSVGNNAELGELSSANYHVYGCWWKSPTEILFYLDGNYVGTVTPVAPFTIGMNLRFVVETYDWNPPPADGGMNGTWDDRTTYYDWVRTWELIDAPDCGGPDALLIADVSGPSSVPDCMTDEYDLAAVAANWLAACGDPGYDDSEIIDDCIINMRDFAQLAREWLCSIVLITDPQIHETFITQDPQNSLYVCYHSTENPLQMAIPDNGGSGLTWGGYSQASVDVWQANIQFQSSLERVTLYADNTDHASRSANHHGTYIYTIFNTSGGTTPEIAMSLDIVDANIGNAPPGQEMRWLLRDDQGQWFLSDDVTAIGTGGGTYAIDPAAMNWLRVSSAAETDMNQLDADAKVAIDEPSTLVSQAPDLAGITGGGIYIEQGASGLDETAFIINDITWQPKKHVPIISCDE